MPTKKYIIIGCGVSGLSTALHLLWSDAALELTIIEHHTAQEPSSDDAKIVRIDYPSPRRMEEALRAQQRWKDDEQFKPFYQPVGRIVAYDEANLETIAAINDARAHLHLKSRPLYDNTLLKRFYGPVQTTDNSSFVWNEDDGLVEWKGCMQAAANTVRDGSRVLKSSVQDIRHAEGLVTTIVLKNGEQIDVANATIVAAVGPWTSELFEHCGIGLPPPSRSPTATGLFAFVLQLSESQKNFFKGKPAFSHIGFAEFLPPTRDDGLAKITCISSFTNIPDGSTVSHVSDVSESSLAIRQMLKMKKWALDYIPELKGAKFVQIKSYWDGMTPTQEPIMSRHPDHVNLFVVGGLSYTRAKDLPILGEDMVKVIRGEPVNPSYGWHQPMKSCQQDQPRLLARGNFTELEREAEADPEVKAWKRKKRAVGYLEEV